MKKLLSHWRLMQAPLLRRALREYYNNNTSTVGSNADFSVTVNAGNFSVGIKMSPAYTNKMQAAARIEYNTIMSNSTHARPNQEIIDELTEKYIQKPILNEFNRRLSNSSNMFNEKKLSFLAARQLISYAKDIKPFNNNCSGFSSSSISSSITFRANPKPLGILFNKYLPKRLRKFFAKEENVDVIIRTLIISTIVGFTTWILSLII